MFLGNNKKLILRIIVALVVVVVFSIFIRNTLGDHISFEVVNNNAKNEQGSLDISSQADIKLQNKEKLTSYLDIDQIIKLEEDLYVFSHAAYSQYGNHTDKPYTIFNISSKITASGNKVTFEGSFFRVKNKVAVTVDKLKNGYIHTSITDKVMSLSFDNYLPSNSAKNQLLGSLPILTPDYSISYLPQDDLFNITLFTEDADKKNEVVSIVKNAIPDSLFDKLVTVQVSSSATGDKGMNTGE